MRDPTTVLLVDDHAMVRQGVRAFLQTRPDIEVVAEAESGEEVVGLSRRARPRRGAHGPHDARRGRRGGDPPPEGPLAAHERRGPHLLPRRREHVFPAIRAGALSYVLKEIGPDELADAVRRAAAGEAVLHPRVAARVVRELHGARRDEPNVFHDLSDRELEVLRLIADGLSNTQIASRLYLSEKTVKSHVSNILSKLHLADR